MLEFDHRDPTTKRGDVASMTGGPWAMVLEEIGKCDVVCANCHRRRTWARRQLA